MTTTFREAYAANRPVSRNGHGPSAPSREPLLAVLGRLAAQHLPQLAVLRTVVLVIAACACFVYAGFLAHPIAGWALAGLSLLVLEFLSTGGRGT